MAEIIRGKYEIIEELGRGGMGVVYKAHQPSLDRIVAIKMLTPDLAKDEELVRRFRQEARIIAKLDHPNIIRVFDIEECDNTFYIIMEFVDGQSLQRLLYDERRFEEGRAINVSVEIAGALAYAHSLGVVHRDIKPDNIMIADGGRVKVMDFGIARLAEADVRTQTGMRLGTPRYMSPEQAAGRAIDGRSDLYSLGLILYGMITGRLPFEGDNPITIALKHIQEAPRPPSDFFPEIHPQLEELILKCLEKEPGKRYDDAQSFSAALNQYRSSLMGTLPPTPVETDGAGETMVVSDAEEPPESAVVVGSEEAPGATVVISEAEEAPGATMIVAETEEAPGATMIVADAEKTAGAVTAAADVTAASAAQPRKGKLRALVGALVVLIAIATVGIVYQKMSSGETNGQNPRGAGTPTATPPPKTPFDDLPPSDQALVLEIINTKMSSSDFNWDSARTSIDELLQQFSSNEDLQAMKASVEAHLMLQQIAMRRPDRPSNETVIAEFDKAVSFKRLWPAYKEYAYFLAMIVKDDYEHALELIQQADNLAPKDSLHETDRGDIQFIISTIEKEIDK